MFYTVKSFVLSIFIVCSALLISFTGQQYLDQRAIETARATKLIEDMQTVKTVKKISSKTMDHVRCLALNIYYEARGEPFLGQVAVARVVMNRVKSGLFPNDPCKVIYQSHDIIKDNDTVKICQFSWVCDSEILPISSKSYKYYEKIAKQVLLENKWSDLLSEDVYYFHSTHVQPRWSRIHNQFITIGNHIFYEQRDTR